MGCTADQGDEMSSTAEPVCAHVACAEAFAAVGRLTHSWALRRWCRGRRGSKDWIPFQGQCLSSGRLFQQHFNQLPWSGGRKGATQLMASRSFFPSLDSCKGILCITLLVW